MQGGISALCSARERRRRPRGAEPAGRGLFADVMEHSPGTGDVTCTKSLLFNLIPRRIS